MVIKRRARRNKWWKRGGFVPSVGWYTWCKDGKMKKIKMPPPWPWCWDSKRKNQQEPFESLWKYCSSNLLLLIMAHKWQETLLFWFGSTFVLLCTRAGTSCSPEKNGCARRPEKLPIDFPWPMSNRCEQGKRTFFFSLNLTREISSQKWQLWQYDAEKEEPTGLLNQSWSDVKLDEKEGDFISFRKRWRLEK